MLHCGLDAHTKYTTYDGLDDAGRLVEEGRMANTREEFDRLFARHPGPCRAATESCLVWPHIHSLIWDLVDEVQLARWAPLSARTNRSPRAASTACAALPTPPSGNATLRAGHSRRPGT